MDVGIYFNTFLFQVLRRYTINSFKIKQEIDAVQTSMVRLYCIQKNLMIPYFFTYFFRPVN